MESADVLNDSCHTVPDAGTSSGVGRLRAHSPRFTEGAAHARHRAAVLAVIERIGTPPNAPTPTASLLRALGLPSGLEADVALVAAAWQPHAPQSDRADAAAERLIAACGTAQAGVLVQAHGPTAALARCPERAPVPSTRRIGPDGAEVEVDLSDAWFGRGPHACPGEHLAWRLAATGAEAFAALHRPGDPFVLPNAWDVASAVLLARAGFPAVGTTSLGVAAARGLPDAGRVARELTLELARSLTRLGVTMVTVDLEDGFSDDPQAVADLAVELWEMGVRGVNLEDATAGALVDPGRHAAKIAAVKSSAPGLFVNARTDTHWLGTDLEDTLPRLARYLDAGANGTFVPGRPQTSTIEKLTHTLEAPLNVLASSTLTRARLAGLGVARISTGSALYRVAMSAARDTARELVEDGLVPADVLSYQEIQAMSSPGGGDHAR